MGQNFSDLVYGNRSSSTPTQEPEVASNTSTPVPEPDIDATNVGHEVAPNTSTPVLEPDIDAANAGHEVAPNTSLSVSNASVTDPEPPSTVTQAFISVSEPISNTNNANNFPQLVLSSKMADYVKEMNRRNNCYGETYEAASYHEEERIRSLIIDLIPYATISRVCVVKNSFLQGMYELKKAEYKARYGKCVKELTMFHATDANNVDSIIKDNLDWRRVYRNKYGIGVSFSEDPDYCNFHCTPQNGHYRVFIVASVLVCRQTYGGYGMVVPPETYDTAVGNNNLVYVKFNDNEFLPKYLAFYEKPPRPLSKHWVNYPPRRW